MSEIAIKVENISKKYDLLHQNKAGGNSLVGAFAGGLKSLITSSHKGETHEDFWALKEINFEIQQGDRVGIIGRNGAGKSTLLKVLSRIVKPTSGRIEYTGRMASLLEVGTGFHGDLSGRENIYLNGSIMGMTKREIDAKFDEIVDFSEVEKFLDTPVKKYSSGMYVRLAFAVAAHLNSDILIVDEVLAVGDASFQKKSLGKMEDASQQSGKTILFVSHNMGQISSLCNKGILLNKGRVEQEGSIQTIIGSYFNQNDASNLDQSEFNYPDDPKKDLQITQIKLNNQLGEACRSFAHDEPVVLAITVEKKAALKDVMLGLFFTDMSDKRIFTVQLPLSDKFDLDNKRTFKLIIPHTTFIPNTYRFSVALHIPNIQLIDEKQNAGKFEIYDNGSELYRYAGTDIGVVFVNCKWEY
jgi:lipopolysaccharide transport system ATP-binding protein